MPILPLFLPIAFLMNSMAWTNEILPEGNAPQSIEYSHFPNRLCAFVWRNWTLVPIERLAEVLDTTPDNVQSIADLMGLPPNTIPPTTDTSRTSITLIRRNWHLLPYEQLLTLLHTTPERLAYSLREDDFLFVKLGLLKPKCEPIRYEPPNVKDLRLCEAIRNLVRSEFSDLLTLPEEPRFHFVDVLSRIDLDKPSIASSGEHRFSPRYVYSYFALYGDPLFDTQYDSYPEGYLQKLAASGVDGVWIHTVLRQLAPSVQFQEFGDGADIRLENLRKLVQRAKKYGIGIYLYLNEPRAMPPAFFENRDDIKGVQEGDYYAVCTSSPLVRQWLTESLAHVFKNVPDLAGAFSISASENLTNCASHYNQADCPRCKDRSQAEIISEVNAAMEVGIHQGNPNACFIAWDWGWKDEWAARTIELLPKSCGLMSVSEWSLPITRGGIATEVGEYSISSVGPGPRAQAHWAKAKQAGLKTLAKVQLNNSWECSAVPYLPVLDLVAEHCENLLKADVDGMMMGWTLGGYPSPNLEIVHQFDRLPSPTKDSVLNQVALDLFGEKGASIARKAWTEFSTAFREFPFNGAVVYNAPLQCGPSNLLYLSPTGYRATMVGIPYDDVASWRGPYPADVFATQLEKVAQGWKIGIDILRHAIEQAPQARLPEVESQLRFARAAQLHFQSVADQVRFTSLRDRLLEHRNTISQDECRKEIAELRKIVEREIDTARQLFALSRQDSRIGFEATNQYYYVPIDLMEKAINCRYVMEQMNEFFAPGTEDEEE